MWIFGRVWLPPSTRTKDVRTVQEPYLVEFLPVLRRSLQRNGITIDQLTYFSTALRAWAIGSNHC